MTDDALRHRLGALRVIPVAVLDDPGRAVGVARALVSAGLPCLEVTLRTDRALDAIAAIRHAAPEVLVGAGTVMWPEQVDDAAAAGASFLVSPGFDGEVIARARRAGVALIPGVATASEALAALRAGVDVVKLFPAATLGGVHTVRAFASVFHGLRYIPTGGIRIEDLRAYLEEPSVLAVGGTWIVPPHVSPDEVRRLAADAVAVASGQVRAA